MQENIHPSKFKITQELRQQALGQNPALIWFTGLSGSGKSTLANATEQALHGQGYHTYLLDGDNVRTGLNRDLNFSKEDRVENIRRIAEVAHLMMDAGLIVLSAFISPFRSDREMIRELVGSGRFLEIHVDCPLKICEERDVKGLYQKARKGLIKDFTGIDSPYETPESPFRVIKTAEVPLDLAVHQLVEALDKKLKR
ncbi:adenylylsulfate kinase [Cyclobacterium xiamenense]|uniref:Adenylyl-sulfate kinase n=1 Tax=Cyclobacterium xiamenense TaxID=1297121 RepID=A0A1H6ZGE9_9BACT|nr:adenylyl-sulfate kinase [Cyclobacterium xiamenense]SEJ51214.1 adenylylsulfate kinase [Cyclobacterium xiamenense]